MSIRNIIMSDINRYKKLLSNSTTMPYGTAQGGSASFLTGANIRPSSSHGSSCSCCGPAGDEMEDDDE